jgi:hypothetical protein
MANTWRELAVSMGPIIGQVAPHLGKMLGGSIGGPIGALAGGAAGSILASILGVPPTPNEVSAKLSVLPESKREEVLAQAESQAAMWASIADVEEAKAADRTAQSQAVNETIRDEKASIPWWHWRHLIGYLVLMVILDVMALITYVVIEADAVRLNFIVAIMGSVTVMLGFCCGLLGYIAGDTSTFKENVLAGAPRESVSSKFVNVARKVAGK